MLWTTLYPLARDSQVLWTFCVLPTITGADGECGSQSLSTGGFCTAMKWPLSAGLQGMMRANRTSPKEGSVVRPATRHHSAYLTPHLAIWRHMPVSQGLCLNTRYFPSIWECLCMVGVCVCVCVCVWMWVFARSRTSKYCVHACVCACMRACESSADHLYHPSSSLGIFSNKMCVPLA